MEWVLLVTGVVLGAVPSWLISRHYYRRAAMDAADGLISQRLDSCSDADKTFLVALAKVHHPISRYALINVEYERLDGTTDRWGSNTSIMTRSLQVRAPHSLCRHRDSSLAEDRAMISLSDRGRENVEYLLRREYKAAEFYVIEDDDAVRAGLFHYEHNRDPKPGRKGGIPIISG